MLAALGVLIAAGHLLQATKLSLLVVVILYGIDLLEDNVKSLSRGVHASVAKRFMRQKKEDEPT